jgi:hypothetical protein
MCADRRRWNAGKTSKRSAAMGNRRSWPRRQSDTSTDPRRLPGGHSKCRPPPLQLWPPIYDRGGDVRSLAVPIRALARRHREGQALSRDLELDAHPSGRPPDHQTTFLGIAVQEHETLWNRGRVCNIETGPAGGKVDDGAVERRRFGIHNDFPRSRDQPCGPYACKSSVFARHYNYLPEQRIADGTITRCC